MRTIYRCNPSLLPLLAFVIFCCSCAVHSAPYGAQGVSTVGADAQGAANDPCEPYRAVIDGKKWWSCKNLAGAHTTILELVIVSGGAACAVHEVGDVYGETSKLPDEATIVSATELDVYWPASHSKKTCTLVPDPMAPCIPYKAQVEFLESSGTWKKCVYHKTYLLSNLTFKSEVDKAGRCIAVAVEDEAASVLCSTVVPGVNEFSGKASDGETTVECSK